MGKRKHSRKIPLKQKLIGDRNLTLQERLESSGFFPEGKINMIQSPGVKMSEVLLDFADPILNGNENISELDRRIGFAMYIWNMSVLTPEDIQDVIPCVAGLFCSDTGQGIAGTLSLIKMLLKRKEEHFSHIKKLIVDYEINQRNGEPSLKVISTPD